MFSRWARRLIDLRAIGHPSGFNVEFKYLGSFCGCAPCALLSSPSQAPSQLVVFLSVSIAQPSSQPAWTMKHKAFIVVFIWILFSFFMASAIRCLEMWIGGNLITRPVWEHLSSGIVQCSALHCGQSKERLINADTFYCFCCASHLLTEDCTTVCLSE